MTRKKTEQAEVLRSKSWMSQPQFDNLIRDIDVSSLRFLKLKYKDEIRNLKQTTDLGISENMYKYKQMEQRFKMVSEELKRRYHDTLLLNDRDIHFSRNHDYVILEDGEGHREIWSVCMDNVGVNTKRMGNVQDDS